MGLAIFQDLLTQDESQTSNFLWLIEYQDLSKIIAILRQAAILGIYA